MKFLVTAPTRAIYLYFTGAVGSPFFIEQYNCCRSDEGRETILNMHRGFENIGQYIGSFVT